MKLVCKKSDLITGINIVMKAVSSKTTMSILECILIDATEGEIKFTANDMELGIETKVEGEIIEAGSIAIDAKIFSEIVRNFLIMMLLLKLTMKQRLILPVKIQNLIFL